MRNRLLLIAATTAIAMVAVPALAYGAFATNYGVSYDAPITNSYGLTFAGQGKCIECHDTLSTRTRCMATCGIRA